jgi:hypothetical protein
MAFEGGGNDPLTDRDRSRLSRRLLDHHGAPDRGAGIGAVLRIGDHACRGPDVDVICVRIDVLECADRRGGDIGAPDAMERGNIDRLRHGWLRRMIVDPEATDDERRRANRDRDPEDRRGDSLTNPTFPGVGSHVFGSSRPRLLSPHELAQCVT